MMYGMVGLSLLVLFLVLGFAHIIWILSVKESGLSKLLGQIVAAVIAVLVIALYIYGMAAGPKMHKGMMGSGMGPGMMNKGMMCPDMMDKKMEMKKEMMKKMMPKAK